MPSDAVLKPGGCASLSDPESMLRWLRISLVLPKKSITYLISGFGGVP